MRQERSSTKQSFWLVFNPQKNINNNKEKKKTVLEKYKKHLKHTLYRLTTSETIVSYRRVNYENLVGTCKHSVMKTVGTRWTPEKKEKKKIIITVKKCTKPASCRKQWTSMWHWP